MTNNDNWGQFVNIEDYNINSDIYNNRKKRKKRITSTVKDPIIYSKLSIYSIISDLLSFVGYELE
jgi:hypothetical protein